MKAALLGLALALAGCGTPAPREQAVEPGTGLAFGGFDVAGSDRSNTFRVEPGSVAYAGTYKLHYKKKGALQRDEASFARVDSRRSEVALLRWLDKELAASAWAAPVRARLAEAEKRR